MPVQGNKKQGYDHEKSENEFMERLGLIPEARWYDPDFRVADLAAEMGCERTVLNRKMKKHIQLNPKTYIRNKRLARARELICAHPEISIAEVAGRSGIVHFGRFAQYFKAEFGLSPAAYRERVRNGYGDKK
jgi:transcriptional regulator GlxA family with amidase domain